MDQAARAILSSFVDTSARSAPIDLYRENGRYVLEADLPGFDPSAIDVSAENGLLTIRADRTLVNEHHGRRALVRERGAARVVRQLSIGGEVDLDAITATYQHGVLRVTLPVRADALPRKVEVAMESSSPTAQTVGSHSDMPEVPGAKGTTATLRRILTRWLPGSHAGSRPGARGRLLRRGVRVSRAGVA